MKKILKYFTCVFVCAFFMFLVGTSKVSANYEASKNKIQVSISSEKMQFKVTYQRGFGTKTARYWWCTTSINADYNSEDFAKKCLDYNDTNSYTNTKTKMVQYNKTGAIVSDKVAEEADKGENVQTFEILVENDTTLQNIKAKNEGYYMLVVEGSFCTLRNLEDETNKITEPATCKYYSDVVQTSLLLVVKDGNSPIDGGGTISGDIDISDPSLSSMVNDVKELINGTIMPVLWVVLGLFLVIKGSVLGVQIVRAADEPQVRQEKIGALKWLIIGVAIATIVSVGTSVLINLFGHMFIK